MISEVLLLSLSLLPSSKMPLVAFFLFGSQTFRSPEKRRKTRVSRSIDFREQKRPIRHEDPEGGMEMERGRGGGKEKKGRQNDWEGEKKGGIQLTQTCWPQATRVKAAVKCSAGMQCVLHCIGGGSQSSQAGFSLPRAALSMLWR